MTFSAPHPDDATLLAHLAQELSEVQLEKLRDHLAACEECVDRLLDLEALRPEAPRAGVADFEMAAAWREMQRLLPEEEQEAHEARPPFFARVPVLRAAAVVLLIATGALALRTVQLHQQLQTMQVNVPVIYFDDVRSAGESAQIPAGEGVALIILTPSDPRRFASYSAELVDAEGRVLQSQSGLLLTEHESLRIAIPRLPGRYTLRLAGVGADGSVPIEEDSLEIR